MDYQTFLENKKHSIGNFGFDANYIPDIAFDFQKHIIEKAILKGRTAIGIELKDSYFKQAKINLSLVEKRFIENAKQVNLFESDNSEM
jgi:hypothetical protein